MPRARPAKKANPNPSAGASTSKASSSTDTKSKRGKRPAEDDVEANKAVPAKSSRTALGRAKLQNVVPNGINNNGPLDDQPRIEEAAPKSSRKRPAPAATLADLITETPGALHCFGNNDCGQLGLDPDVEKRKFPAKVPNLEGKKIVDIACGGMHTLALEDNGKVWSFGVNDDKALGRATEEEEDGFEPGLVDLPKDVKVVQITAGDSHSAALTSTGEVYVWGCFKDTNGNFGLVADDGEICRQQPQNITASLGVKMKKIASGGHHLAMLSTDDNLYTCGTGDQGQLGRQEPTVTRPVTRSMNRTAGELTKKQFLLNPTFVKVGRGKASNVKDIWTGEFSTYCTNGKDIFVFGLNNYSQLGIPNTNGKKIVISVPTNSTNFKGKMWKQIAAGQHHAIALDDKGMVYSLGRGDYGRLGLGEGIGDMVDKPTLIEQLAETKCRRIAAGASTSYAVTEDGKLFSWGFGENWQLATGEDEDALVPSKTFIGRDKDFPSEVLKISAGGQHAALTIKSE